MRFNLVFKGLKTVTVMHLLTPPFFLLGDWYFDAAVRQSSSVLGLCIGSGAIEL